jgi:hypothetical protein
MSKVLRFSKPPLRYIELRATDRRRGSTDLLQPDFGLGPVEFGSRPLLCRGRIGLRFARHPPHPASASLPRVRLQGGRVGKLRNAYSL